MVENSDHKLNFDMEENDVYSKPYYKEAIKKYFSHCNQVDCRHLEVGEMIIWLKDHFDEDGCAFTVA